MISNRFKYKFLVLLFFLLLVYPTLSAQGSSFFVTRKIVNSDNATFELSNLDFSRRVYALFGKWEFYWDTLLTPKQIAHCRNLAHLVKVPDNWANYQIDGRKLPAFGYATYHIKVKLPKDLKTVALSFHGVFTSYKLWINGRFIDENGKVATDKIHQKGTWLPKTYIVPVENGNLDIVLQVSNFVHFKGGILRQVVIGSPKQMYKYSMLGVSYEAGLIGAMLIMALYFLFFFYYQPNNISPLYLAIVLISQALITSLDGEYIMYRIFPNFSLRFGVHLLYVLFFYRTILFLHYLYHLAPKEINIKVIFVLTSIYFLMTLYVIFLPIKLFSFALMSYIILSTLMGVYMIYALFKLIKYQIGAVYTLVGVLILLLSGINDALYDFGVIHTFYMAGLGFLVFVFVLSMMIAMHNAKAQGQVLAYSIMLKKLNVLREELMRIPFYNLGEVLKIVTKVINSNRGIWLDKPDQELKVSYEYYLNKLKSVDKYLSDLPNNFIEKNSIRLVEKHKKLFTYSLSKKEIRRGKKNKYKTALTKYLLSKDMVALAVSPIVKDDEVLSILYLENRYNRFSSIQRKLLHSINAQLAALKANAESYQKLQEINRKLEQLVEERTAVLKEKEKELEEREVQLQEKIEELQAYNEQINRLHAELERHKYEIEQRNFELEKLHSEIYYQKKLAEQRNQTLTEEIKFAQKIQNLILRIEPNLPFTDLFILYLPKSIVSGDFYWIKRFGNKLAIAVADCTGHGIPGAFMSVLGSTLLNEIFSKFYFIDNNLNIKPSDVLEQLREQIIKTLGQEKSLIEQVKDGMDIALLLYDEQTNYVEFSGAYLSLWVVRDKELIELKGDRQPIGVYYKPELRKPFTTKSLQLQKGDSIYMFTDGYSDQFNPQGQKFFRKNLRKVLIEISDYPGSIQRDFLLKVFQDWKGDHYQVDDVLILGIII